MISRSGKEIEENDNVQNICLLYDLISVSEDNDISSVGFQRNFEDQDRHLAKNKATIGKYHVRCFLKDVFGFAEHHENATYVLAYKITLLKNSDDHVLSLIMELMLKILLW